MQEFVRTETGLEEAARSKIRNYQNLNCVKEAIANGELKEHDLFTTVCSVEATGDDLASIIYWLCALTPDNASPDNQFATMDDLSGVAGESVTCSDFDTYQTDMANYLTSMQSDIDDAMACKVDCSDYTDKMNDVDTALTNLSNNKVTCSDYSTTVSNINTNLSGKVACTDYNSYTSCVNTRLSTLESKPGLNCTGTIQAITLNGSAFSISGTTATLSGFKPATACNSDCLGGLDCDQWKAIINCCIEANVGRVLVGSTSCPNRVFIQ